MLTLYQKASELTARSAQNNIADNDENNEKELLEQHIVELFSLIESGIEQNVLRAASAGRDNAIICIYKTDARLRGVIPVHSILCPSDSLRAKYHAHNIKPLRERLSTSCAPFVLSIDNGANVLRDTYTELDDIMCVLLSWK